MEVTNGSFEEAIGLENTGRDAVRDVRESKSYERCNSIHNIIIIYNIIYNI